MLDEDQDEDDTQQAWESSAPDNGDRGAAFDSGPFGGPLGANGPAGSGMMPLNEAVAAQSEMRKHAVLRPIQRALPRGRT